jgi:hypothetical protein
MDRLKMHSTQCILSPTNTSIALILQLLKLSDAGCILFDSELPMSFFFVLFFFFASIAVNGFFVDFYACVLILIVTPPSLKAELALWKCRGGNLPQHLKLLANSRRQGQILMHFPPLHTQPVGHQKTEVLKLWNADHHEAQCLRYFIITRN